MKNKKNFMDYIPIRNLANTWEEDEEHIVTVHVVNKGFFNRVAQKLFKRPKISHIRLDKYGSFVWSKIDGERDLYELSRLVEAEFGKEAEPIVERLVKYFQILYQNKFILYKRN